jgi:putative transposase
MCQVLQMPKSSYYLSLQKTSSKREQENADWTEKIRVIHQESKERYGAPKIHHILKQNGASISLKRVQRLMKKAQIRSITKKKYKPFANKATVVQLENHLKRDFSTTSILQKWVTDITYVPTVRDGWCYLASVMDLHSKKIVGYSFSRSMTTDLVLQALKNAYETQHPAKGVLLHSDLGSQYTSKDYTEYAQSLGMILSFSQKGCPYDNACIESFHAIFKKEEIHHHRYMDFPSAKRAIFQFIEGWYNRKRIHSRLNYLTPQDVEDLIRQSA